MISAVPGSWAASEERLTLTGREESTYRRSRPGTTIVRTAVPGAADGAWRRLLVSFDLPTASGPVGEVQDDHPLPGTAQGSIRERLTTHQESV